MKIISQCNINTEKVQNRKLEIKKPILLYN
jgi:hypothetical protein